MLVIEADPEHRPPAPGEGAAETTLHAVTMVIIRGNHRDYNSSGIVCEINMGARRATVRERKKCSSSMMFIPSIKSLYMNYI